MFLGHDWHLQLVSIALLILIMPVRVVFRATKVLRRTHQTNF